MRHLIGFRTGRREAVFLIQGASKTQLLAQGIDGKSRFNSIMNRTTGLNNE
jgi:hypothetical protein